MSILAEQARWAVLWVGKKGWVCKEFENDFTSAMDLYVKVKKLEARGATLLCRNYGFPPPYSVKKLRRINRAGALWCPYCRQLRRFVKRSGFFVGEVFIPEVNMQCPVCGIQDTNHNVRKYNPALSPMTEVVSNGRSGEPVRGRRSGGNSSKLTEEQRAAKRERARRRRERGRA